MKFVTQTKFSQRGNCFRACLATLLNIDIDFMPPFEEQSDNVWIPAKQWLLMQGLTICNYHSESPPDGYSIAVGQSPRNPSIHHAVVALNGKQHFDPHPSCVGLNKIDRYWQIEKVKVPKTDNNQSSFIFKIINRKQPTEAEVTHGSGNVYKDLGFNQPEEMFKKAFIVTKIRKQIEALGGYESAYIYLCTAGLDLESICRGGFINIQIEHLRKLEIDFAEILASKSSELN
jgi:hypothetical protein